ncbi:MobA/MobL family protein [Psychrobacter urativorans]|uniref:MobA/MobL family protein n=1 Tax=Psychrobacter urativorans TaxID=45610 RepID=UPI001D0D4C4C|nr:MobA/MobL family protein [Psychrobacter urativorans]
MSVGIGKKGKASPHAKYIAREGKYAKLMKDKEDLNYKGKEELEYRGHGNMPKWAEHNPNYFWQMADEHERKNGSTYREHVITLPRELYVNERHELIEDWIAQEIGGKHAYQYAIHNPPALDGDEQPHAHIMFSERTIDGIERDPDQYFKRYNSKNPEKGGAKKANTPKMSAERKEELKAMRDRWEKICNAHLERGFHSERISMKSLKEQGIQREPLNLTMAQLKQPEIKEAYRELLAAKNDDFMAELDVWMEFYDDNLEDEIKNQLAQKHEAERQAQAQQEAKKEAELEAQALQQEKQEVARRLKLEAQQQQDLKDEKSRAKAQAAEAEQARPKTAKEYVERLSKEQRQKVKDIASNTISQYSADISSKAVELYEKATPPNQRAKPLFAHYAYSDMNEVQPYKSLAQREIHKKDPSRYKDYANAVEITNAIQDMERSEGYQRQAERTREQNQDKSKNQGIER